MYLVEITATQLLKPIAANDVPDKERPNEYHSIAASDCSIQRLSVNVTIVSAATRASQGRAAAEIMTGAGCW